MIFVVYIPLAGLIDRLAEQMAADESRHGSDRISCCYKMSGGDCQRPVRRADARLLGWDRRAELEPIKTRMEEAFREHGRALKGKSKQTLAFLDPDGRA